MNDLHEWAQRHAVSPAALAELANVLGAAAQPANTGTGSEGRVQSLVRLAAPGHGMRLFRNNVGALLDSRGVPVRYGLANDTPALNRRLKSSDLIGWKRVVVSPAMVGQVVAIFTAIECKQEGWKYRGDDHEAAQLRWLTLVASDGGLASFSTGQIPDAQNVLSLQGG